MATLLASVVVARSAAAQLDPGFDGSSGPSASAAAAYLALTTTPVGAFAPTGDYMLRRPGMAPPPIRFHGRFGSLDRGPGASQRAWGATFDLPVASTALELTAGMVDLSCDDLENLGDPDVSLKCKSGVNVGARLGAPFFSRSIGAAGNSALVVGWEGTAGYGSTTLFSGTILGTPVDFDLRALTATAALPIALPVRSGSVTVAPMVTPRFAYGHAKISASGLGVDGDSESRAGGRFMLGAGVMVRIADRMGFDAGLQKVYVDQGETAYGLGISIGF